MELALLIIAFAHVVIFVSRGGVATMIAPAASCYAAPRVLIFPMLTAAVVTGVILAPQSQTALAGITPRALFIAFTAAFAAYGISRNISSHISRLYLIEAALIGGGLVLEEGMIIGWRALIGWVAAPIICFLLATLIYRVISRAMRLSDSRYLNFLQGSAIVISATTLLLFGAVGLNIGTQLKGLSIEPWSAVAMLGVIAVAILHTGYKKLLRIVSLREREFDINPQSAIAIMLSATTVITLFSFDASAALIGAESTLISPVVVIFAALAACSWTQGRRVMSGEEQVRMGVANIVALIIALVLGYLLSTLLQGEWNSDMDLRSMMLFVAIIAVVLLTIISLQNNMRMRRKSEQAQEQAELLEENRRSLNRMEVEAMQAENENLRNQLELKRKEVMSVAMNITEQKEFINHLYEELKQIRKVEDTAEKDRMLDKLHTDLSLRMNFTSERDSFYTQVEQLHKDFGVRLTEKFPDLTRQERRLVILLRLDFSTKYIATLMNISPKSVEISRHRLRTKLGLKREQNLTNFIKTI